MRSRNLLRRLFSYNREEMLQTWKTREQAQVKSAAANLTEFQQKRINIIADVILDMTDGE
jgi:large subunit ribosomal protein L7/L12